MKDQLKRLVELQALDSEIYALRKNLTEKPIFIEELKQKFETQKANLKSLEDKFKTLQVERKSKELELQAKEGDIAKANTQLFSLKTNKEYQVKLAEIENFKADKSVMEEKVLILYDEGDAICAEIEKEKKFLTEEEKKYIQQKKEIEEEVKSLQDKLAVLETKRKQIEPEIEKASLSRYERILENKEGLALVPVVGSACGGCFMNTPPQVINEIKMHERLVACEMCARILYLEEDL